MPQEPAEGDEIWHEGLGSGIITGIDWSDKTIYADYYEKGSLTYEWDDVIGTWDNAYGGTWMIFNHFNREN